MDILERDYLACFEYWKKLILWGGDYFKGNKIDFKKLIKIFHFTNKFTLLFSLPL